MIVRRHTARWQHQHEVRQDKAAACAYIYYETLNMASSMGDRREAKLRTSMMFSAEEGHRVDMELQQHVGEASGV